MKDLDVLNQLLTSTALTTIIGDKIWADWLPENTALPAVTCNFASDRPTITLTGDTLTDYETITVNCWANDKVTLNSMVDAVKISLQTFGVRQNKVDLSEEQRGIYRTAMDYSISG